MRNGRLLAGLITAESGNVMVLSALSMLAIAGGAGIATDTIQWSLWQREMQRAADSAALAAALAKAQGGDATSTAQTEVGRYNLPDVGTPEVNTSPTGHTSGVRVALSKTRKLPFSSLFMATTPTIRAEATADVVSFGEYCVRALENTTATGIDFGGNSTATLRCGVHANSQGASAVTAGGSSEVYTSPISAVGAVPVSSNFKGSPVYQPYSLTQPDPYANLPNPIVPNGCSPKEQGKKSGLATLNPGCYKGMDLDGKVKFNPGIYVIDGDFNLGSNAEVSGDGVVFVLTSSTAATVGSSVGNIKMNAQALMNLTAPDFDTSSDSRYAVSSYGFANTNFDGVLFYQDRRATDKAGNVNIVNGKAGSVLEGAIYLPSQSLNFNGTADMITTCLNIVTRRVSFSGNFTLDNDCPDYDDRLKMLGLQIRLVS